DEIGKAINRWALLQQAVERQGGARIAHFLDPNLRGVHHIGPLPDRGLAQELIARIAPANALQIDLDVRILALEFVNGASHLRFRVIEAEGDGGRLRHHRRRHGHEGGCQDHHLAARCEHEVLPRRCDAARCSATPAWQPAASFRGESSHMCGGGAVCRTEPYVILLLLSNRTSPHALRGGSLAPRRWHALPPPATKARRGSR